MDSGQKSPTMRELREQVPSLINYISSNGVAGFDSIEEETSYHRHHNLPSPSHIFSTSARESTRHDSEDPILSKPHDAIIHSMSISMPPSPSGHHTQNARRVLFCDHTPSNMFNKDDQQTIDDAAIAAAESRDQVIVDTTPQAKFYSQPMPKGAAYIEARVNSPLPELRRPTLRDARFDSFKTWSGKLERQFSLLRGRPVEPEPYDQFRSSSRLDGRPSNYSGAIGGSGAVPPSGEALPVDRYFDALEGPELDTLRPSEEMVLPGDQKWPFLLRYQISSFGVCLGVSSQAILWKTLATSISTKFLHISLAVNYVLWCISLALIVVIASIYTLKLILYFEAVRREYYHPIRVNFFFAPWIALLFLAMGVPSSITETLPHTLWYVLMAPIFILELKIYGQWMSGGQRRLSKVANPSNHLSVVGNFVGALFGASIGLKEGPIFFFAVGLAHYTVLFVTLYQRLPTNETLPKELHPVFFLFVAAPSVASMAWAKIQGEFDYGSRIAYFIALFLYFSLAVRVNFFRGFRFSLAWWAYTFPMTGAAIATIRYSNEATNIVTRTLAIILSAVSTLTVTALLVTTIIHAFVLHDLFPNDNAIAISDRPPRTHHLRKWFHLRHASSDNKDIEQYLKYVNADQNMYDEGGNGNVVVEEAPTKVDDIEASREQVSPAHGR